MKMKLIFVLIIAGLILAGCNNGNRLEDGGESKVGTKVSNMAPDFLLPNIKGEEISLKDFRGKNVVLNFWALWCPYCIVEMPDLNRFHKEYEDKGFVVIGINLGDNRNNVQTFLEEEQIQFPILLDVQKTTSSIYSIGPIPLTFFIDKSGVILYKQTGAMEYTQIEKIAKRME